MQIKKIIFCISIVIAAWPSGAMSSKKHTIKNLNFRNKNSAPATVIVTSDQSGLYKTVILPAGAGTFISVPDISTVNVTVKVKNVSTGEKTTGKYSPASDGSYDYALRLKKRQGAKSEIYSKIAVPSQQRRPGAGQTAAGLADNMAKTSGQSWEIEKRRRAARRARSSTTRPSETPHEEAASQPTTQPVEVIDETPVEYEPLPHIFIPQPNEPITVAQPDPAEHPTITTSRTVIEANEDPSIVTVCNGVEITADNQEVDETEECSCGGEKCKCTGDMACGGTYGGELFGPDGTKLVEKWICRAEDVTVTGEDTGAEEETDEGCRCGGEDCDCLSSEDCDGVYGGKLFLPDGSTREIWRCSKNKPEDDGTGVGVDETDENQEDTGGDDKKDDKPCKCKGKNCTCEKENECPGSGECQADGCSASNCGCGLICLKEPPPCSGLKSCPSEGCGADNCTCEDSCKKEEFECGSKKKLCTDDGCRADDCACGAYCAITPQPCNGPNLCRRDGCAGADCSCGEYCTEQPCGGTKECSCGGSDCPAGSSICTNICELSSNNQPCGGTKICAGDNCGAGSSVGDCDCGQYCQARPCGGAPSNFVNQEASVEYDLAKLKRTLDNLEDLLDAVPAPCEFNSDFTGKIKISTVNAMCCHESYVSTETGQKYSGSIGISTSVTCNLPAYSIGVASVGVRLTLALDGSLAGGGQSMPCSDCGWFVTGTASIKAGGGVYGNVGIGKVDIIDVSGMIEGGGSYTYSDQCGEVKTEICAGPIDLAATITFMGWSQSSYRYTLVDKTCF